MRVHIREDRGRRSMTIDTRHREKIGEISREHSPIVVFARPFAGTKHEPFLTVYFCEYLFLLLCISVSISVSISVFVIESLMIDINSLRLAVATMNRR